MTKVAILAEIYIAFSSFLVLSSIMNKDRMIKKYINDIRSMSNSVVSSEPFNALSLFDTDPTEWHHEINQDTLVQFREFTTQVFAGNEVKWI